VKGKNWADTLVEAIKKDHDRELARIAASGPVELTPVERLLCVRALQEQESEMERTIAKASGVTDIAVFAAPVLRDIRRLRMKLDGRPLDLAHERMVDEQIAAGERYMQQKARERKADT